MSRGRIEEQRTLSLGTLVRRLVRCHSGSRQLGHCFADITHLEAKVVKARSVLLEPVSDRVIRDQGLDELEVRVPNKQISP